MDYGVYLESSIVDLKPRILDFLTKLVEKAKEAKEYAISFKKKEIAEITGKDIRTASRYLNELEKRNIITTRGVRGRAGGTIIMFNADLIRFDTSDKAFINSEEPITIDDIVEKKFPKKEKEDKKPTRNRRTKQQMIEARALQEKEQFENDRLNDKVVALGGVPNWEWFKETDDPVGNYRTYLITRLYNRYAALFTDKHNFEVANGLTDGFPVKFIQNNYDVLPERFFGSSKWHQFEKFRKFCEENSIDPALYLSAQFNRSIYEGSRKKNSKIFLPFVNALVSDTSYNVYLQYCEYQKNLRHTFLIPHAFMTDFVVSAIIDAYETADRQLGLLEYRATINDFFRGEGFGAKELALLNFYDLTNDNLRKQGVSFKTRDTIKKFVMLQVLIQTSGVSGLPRYLVVGSEMTQTMLASISKFTGDKKLASELKKTVLGKLAYPNLPEEEQKAGGSELYTQLITLYETPKVLQLIMERKGLNLTLADLNAAFKEYGKEKIPVDDYSMLDVDKVVEFMGNAQEFEGSLIDYNDPVIKQGWELLGSVSEDPFEELLSDLK